MANEIYPNVGQKGLFIALAPFGSVVNPQVSYEVISVESIGGLLARGDDPLVDIYVANGLSEAQFNNAKASNVKIIGLQGENGALVSIPNDYLSVSPDSNGVKYSCVMLGISLSAIPDKVDLTPIKQEIHDLVKTRMGVNNTVKAVVIGPPNVLTAAQHYAIESTRAANISGNKSIGYQLIEVTRQRDALLLKVTQLENYIKANMPP